MTVALRDLPRATQARLRSQLPLGQLPPARGRLDDPDRARMNGTERAYADWLDEQIRLGQVAAWWFESLKFRLAGEATTLTPDFLVQTLPEGFLEIHEVKGHWEEDARAKIKVAAELFPCFTWRAVKRVGRGRPTWTTETFSRR